MSYQYIAAAIFCQMGWEVFKSHYLYCVRIPVLFGQSDNKKTLLLFLHLQCEKRVFKKGNGTIEITIVSL